MPLQPATRDTRQSLIDAAGFLFWENGYAATGVAGILARAKVNSGSFYHFFKSKEALLLAVLDWYLMGLEPFVMQPAFARSSDPVERVFGVLAFYRQNLIKTGCTYGCPIGRLALEIPEDRAEVHRLLAENFDEWTAAIEACLEAARDRLPPDLDRASLSQFVLTVMEGGVMQSRAHRRIGPFDASVGHLRRYFELLTQPPHDGRAVTPPRPIPRAGGPRKITHRALHSGASMKAHGEAGRHVEAGGVARLRPKAGGVARFVAGEGPVARDRPLPDAAAIATSAPARGVPPGRAQSLHHWPAPARASRQ